MADLRVPSGLVESASTWWGDEGRAWLADLPRVLGDLERRWRVSVGPAFEPGGCTAFAAPATAADGSAVVVKIAYPHREVRQEARALGHWDGRGSVRLLAEAGDHLAVLLERCQPGHALGDSGDVDVVAVAAGVLRRLWRPVPDLHGFETLEAVTSEWADRADARWRASGRPFDDQLVRQGVELLRTLPPSASRSVLVHGDFHPWNVLAAEREPWLAIDPKPLMGDPAFDVVQLVLHDHPGRTDDPAGVVRARLAELADSLGLDPERMQLWGIARMVQRAFWSLSVGNDTEDDAMADADLLRSLGPLR